MGRPTEFYTGLLTSQYQSSVNLKALLAALLRKLADITACVDSINTAFDIDTAAGAQLDVLGKILGIERTLPFQPNFGISPIMTDSDYRILLRARIGLNHWDGSQTGLYALWQTIFPDATICIHDNHYMDMDVFVSFPNKPSIFIDCINNGLIVPKPTAVLQRLYIAGTFPLFGFDYDDPYVSGFDRGNWYTADINRWPRLGFDSDDTTVSGFDRGNWYSYASEPGWLLDDAGAPILDERGNPLRGD